MEALERLSRRFSTKDPLFSGASNSDKVGGVDLTNFDRFLFEYQHHSYNLDQGHLEDEKCWSLNFVGAAQVNSMFDSSRLRGMQ